jgi:hypothetical protein
VFAGEFQILVHLSGALSMNRLALLMAVVLASFLPQVASAATFGFTDDFSAAGTNLWGGGTPADNPGSDGAGGPEDGFLRLAQGISTNFGVRTTNINYQGDWVAAGITRLSLRLNDIGTDEPFEIHVLISDGALATTWQYNIGFDPPAGCWKRFVVDMTDSSKWTRTRGASSFETVLQNVERVTIRHDLAPYTSFPDPIAGDLGIDQIQLDQTPVVCNDPFADADGDGDVDQDDLGVFQRCLNDGCGLMPPACACFDRDADDDVDGEDLAVFEMCASGPGVDADPACDD